MSEPTSELLAETLAGTLEEAAFVFAQTQESPPPFPAQVLEARIAYAGPSSGVLLLVADSSMFAEPNPDRDGLFFGGGLGLLGEQILANAVVLVYAFAVTWVIATVLKATIGLRVATDSELEGLDRSEHAEAAYS